MTKHSNRLGEILLLYAAIALSLAEGDLKDVSGVPSASIIGCFQDDDAHDNLNGAPIFWTQLMTQNVCTAYCVTLGFRFAGLTSQSGCTCTNGDYKRFGACTNSAGCTQACAGDSSQYCGAYNCDLVIDTLFVGPRGSILPKAAYVGCFQDDYTKRNLNGLPILWANNMSQTVCTSYCASHGFRYAGTVSSTGCTCTNGNYDTYGACSSSLFCNQVCLGDPSQVCGNFNCDLVMDTTFVGLGTSGVIISSILGCYQDSESHDNLNGATIFWSVSMTQTICTSHCMSLGFRYAGLTASSGCTCTSASYNRYGICKSSVGCALPCAGDSTQICGSTTCVLVVDTTITVAAPGVTIDTTSAVPSSTTVSADAVELSKDLLRWSLIVSAGILVKTTLS